MAGRTSKNKGKSGERELCKILGKYLGGSFQRVPDSGAFIGGTNNIRKEKLDEAQIRIYKADIIPPSNLKKLVIESKFYSKFPYHCFATSLEIPILNKWIEELEHDCDENDFGIICVKINLKGWMIGVSEAWDDLQFDNYVVYNGYKFTGLEKFLKDNFEKVIKICE